jgi:outer membrane biosynthesis protein TonB
MEAPARDPEVSSSKDVPELHLLLEMDDERSPWRAAVLISIVIHALACLTLISVSKWIPKSAIVLPVVQPSKDNTFILAPPDTQRVKPPNTDIISDKNRVAQSPTPLPDRNLIRKLMDAHKPGPPAAPAPPSTPPQQAAQQNPAQASPQEQNGAENPQAQPQTSQTAQLQAPPQAKGAFSPFKRTQAPGIEHAIQSIAAGQSAVHYTFAAAAGDYGSMRSQPNSHLYGDVEILNDTMGVDFGPYLQRVLYTIRKNWINLIPEGAQSKKGKLAIQFAILPDGSIRGMQGVLGSGDVVLDRAAWGGITNSDPLDRLPTDFKGDFLQLRILFFYNLDLNGNEIR